VVFISGARESRNPDMDMIEPDSFGTGISLNPYLQGYNDGMITARNSSTGCCMVGGCLLGASGVTAGVFAPSVLFGDPYRYSETTQKLITILSLVGGIAAGVGSVYLANDILNVPIPDPMAEDSLYRKGFMKGYRVGFKSQRLRESLKGTAIGVGTTCAGYAAYVVFLLVLLLREFGDW